MNLIGKYANNQLIKVEDTTSNVSVKNIVDLLGVLATVDVSTLSLVEILGIIKLVANLEFNIPSIIQPIISQIINIFHKPNMRAWDVLSKNNQYHWIIQNRRFNNASTRDKQWTIACHADGYEPQNNFVTHNTQIDEILSQCSDVNRDPIMELPVMDDTIYVETRTMSREVITKRMDFVELDDIMTIIMVLNKCNLIDTTYMRCLVAAQKTCHIILLPEFWQIINSQLTNRYDLFQYAYYMLYNEYLVARKQSIRISDKYVFDHATAQLLSNQLPLDATPPTIICMNPYHLRNAPIPIICTRKLTDPIEFAMRMNVVCRNIWQLPLRKYNAAICGSSLIPCVAHNPLEKCFASFEDYIGHFYPGHSSAYDIPRITIHSHNYHVAKVTDLCIDYWNEDKIAKSSIKLKGLANDPFENVRCKLVHLHRDVKKTSNIISDIDIHITAPTVRVFKEKVYALFEDLASRCEVYLTKVMYEHSKIPKYCVHGPGIPRDLEIFYNSESHIGLVDQFYLSVVRMYYDGDLYMTIAAFSALTSGVNHDMTWRVCGKSPGYVIIKYAKRGYTTILNDSEIIMLNNYYRHIDKHVKIVYGRQIHIPPSDLQSAHYTQIESIPNAHLIAVMPEVKLRNRIGVRMVHPAEENHRAILF